MHTKIKTTAAALALAACGWACQVGADAINTVIPAPAVDTPAAEATGLQTAVLAGGCFWGLQGMFEHVQGVTKVVAGYAGGSKETAHYEMVGTERTGHAESVEITYDPKRISYGQLLRLYFAVAHDPTELNRQGPDSGPSYRSEIFFKTPAQERIAKAYVEQLTKGKVFKGPIVTRIEPLKGFYPAEDYHQDFLIHNPNHPYIVRNDLPKIDALKRVYPELYRETPVMVSSVR
ncbi:MAG TPA: peptide-methionine (S)-S-oxide reductase MsrA [Thermoanaerobaculia bacterium]|jgi:peptide-methionine (S)-S-oxide reductase|nr:peptide-methionine (S)-S-oxide reductase MsrA [Thermoanaerobaculia bacterium]